jgi:hypothetical protein
LHGRADDWDHGDHARAPCAIGVRMFSFAEDRIGERNDMRMDAAEVADDAQE